MAERLKTKKSSACDVSGAIREWGEMRERLGAGGVTQVDRDTWRDSHTPHTMVDREDGRVVTQRDGSVGTTKA